MSGRALCRTCGSPVNATERASFGFRAYTCGSCGAVGLVTNPGEAEKPRRSLKETPPASRAAGEPSRSPGDAQEAARLDEALEDALAQWRRENAKPARKKFGNEPTEVDGIRFDSKLEARRYSELVVEARAGRILELELQKLYRLEVNGVLVATYRPDFVYRRDGKLVVEDAKGYRNDRFPMKKKLMLALFGVEVIEWKG